MSRGQGKIERAVRALLDAHDGLDAQRLTVLVFQDDVAEEAARPITDSEFTTVRRTLARLVNRGDVARVRRRYGWERGRRLYCRADRLAMHMARLDAEDGARREAVRREREERGREREHLRAQMIAEVHQQHGITPLDAAQRQDES